MKIIKWIGKNGYTPNIGKVERGKEYSVTQNVAKEMIAQHLAAEVKPQGKSTPKGKGDT